MEKAGKLRRGRPRIDRREGEAPLESPLAIRLTAEIEAGLKEIASLRGDGLDRSALVRVLLAQTVRAELGRLRALPSGIEATAPMDSPRAQ